MNALTALTEHLDGLLRFYPLAFAVKAGSHELVYRYRLNGKRANEGVHTVMRDSDLWLVYAEAHGLVAWPGGNKTRTGWRPELTIGKVFNDGSVCIGLPRWSYRVWLRACAQS